jgi:hypothetical protein
MRYKQAADKKLDQLENMLVGFTSRFSDPSFNITIAKDMVVAMKEKVEEIRQLINNEPQD